MVIFLSVIFFHRQNRKKKPGQTTVAAQYEWKKLSAAQSPILSTKIEKNTHTLRAEWFQLDIIWTLNNNKRSSNVIIGVRCTCVNSSNELSGIRHMHEPRTRLYERWKSINNWLKHSRTHTHTFDENGYFIVSIHPIVWHERSHQRKHTQEYYWIVECRCLFATGRKIFNKENYLDAVPDIHSFLVGFFLA